MTTHASGIDWTESKIRAFIDNRLNFILRNDVCSIDFSYNVRRGTWNILTAVYGCVVIEQFSYRRPVIEDGHLILEGMSENLSIEINPAKFKLSGPIDEEVC